MNNILPPRRDPWVEKANDDPEGTANALLDIIEADRTKIARALDALNATYSGGKYAMSKNASDALLGRDR